MNSVMPKTIPSTHITQIFRKQNSHALAELYIFGQGACDQAGAGCVQDQVFPSEKRRATAHHELHPFRILLSSRAIFDDGLKKRMASGGSKCIVSNLPIHVVMGAQVTAEGWPFKWKYAARREEIREPRSQQDIQIKIKASVTINRQIPEEIVALDGERKRIKYTAVLAELPINERLYLLIVKKQVLIIRIQQSYIRNHGSGAQRLISMPASLDNSLWYLVRHDIVGLRLSCFLRSASKMKSVVFFRAIVGLIHSWNRVNHGFALQFVVAD